MRKPISSISNSVSKAYYLMKVKNSKTIIMGSNATTDMLYPNDFDQDEIIYTNKNETKFQNELLKSFKSIFKNLKKQQKKIFITEFKCGTYDNKPVKWNYNEILEGQKVIDNTNIKFVDMLKDKSMIKFDVITLETDSRLIRVTNTYKIRFSNGNKINEEKEDFEQNMKDQIKIFVEQQNYVKALKRKYNIYEFNGEEESKDAQIILSFLNSGVGKLYKAKNDFETIKLLFDSGYNNPYHILLVKHFCEVIKTDLSTVSIIKLNNIFFNKFNKLLKYRSYEKIYKAVDELHTIIKNKLLLYLEKNKIVKKYLM